MSTVHSDQLGLNAHKSKLVLQTILFSLWRHTSWENRPPSESCINKQVSELGELKLLTTGNSKKELMCFPPGFVGVAQRVVRTLERIHTVRHCDESFAKEIIQQAVDNAATTAGKTENCLNHLVKCFVNAFPHEGPWRISEMEDQLISSTGHTVLFCPPDVSKKILKEILAVRAANFESATDLKPAGVFF